MAETNWNKISFGKCKHAFLLEAYKQGKEINKAEEEAEDWAGRSMRILADLTEAEQETELTKTIDDKFAKGQLF